MTMEVELKLLVTREDFERVLTAEAVRHRASGRARSAEISTVYYDTPELDLCAEGLALRLRQSGGRWLQAVKGGMAGGAAGGGAAGLHQREEYEWPVAGRRVDLTLLDATPYGPVFAKRRVREALRPVFSTRFRRTVRRLALAPGVEAELCADLGEIRAGTKRQPICEIEVELDPNGADPLALFGFARELLLEIPFRLGAFSKAERGYALARTPLPRKASAVALRPDMKRFEAVRTIARGCLAQIHANEEGLLQDKDPEYLHQLRVGFRRLRVALAIPEDPDWRAALEPVREEFRWLFSALGPARTWDVFVTEMLPPLSRHFGADKGIAAFRTRCLRLRRRHFVAAREAVSSTRYQALLLSIGALLARPPPVELADTATPALALAHAVIQRRDRVLRKRGEALAEASADERHRARIAAKKLRYCAELFASLFAQKKVKRYVGALADLQDVLGAVNDAAASAALIVEAGASRRADARVAGVVQGWIAAGESRAIERLARAWDEFAERKPFWD